MRVPGRSKPASRRLRLKWSRWGTKAGGKDAASSGVATAPEVPDHGAAAIEQLRAHWRERLRNAKLLRLSPSLYRIAADGYARAYFKRRNMRGNIGVLLPSRRTVCAVLSLKLNASGGKLPKLLDMLSKLAFDDAVCLLTDTSERQLQAVRAASKATILYCGEDLDPDAGRALAAKLAVGDVVLFLDDQTEPSEEQLLAFVREIEKGADIAISDASPYMLEFARREPVSMVRQFLNFVMDRADLAANSLQMLPHAITRSACETIGYANLAVPPKAQAIAMLNGLSMRVAAAVVPRRRSVRQSAMSRKQLSDHLEAIRLLFGHRGMRLHYADKRRKRHIAEKEDPLADDQHHHS